MEFLIVEQSSDQGNGVGVGATHTKINARLRRIFRNAEGDLNIGNVPWGQGSLRQKMNGALGRGGAAEGGDYLKVRVCEREEGKVLAQWV